MRGPADHDLGTASVTFDPSRHRGAGVVGLVLLIVSAAFAVSVDVGRAGYGIKGDEATYVAMALSAAYDGDLTYERRDLDRFVGLYHAGPEGIFLKRGKTIDLRLRRAFPYVRVTKSTDPRTDRLYFGKSYVYALVAAPFVRLLGLNGLLLLHVLLLGAVCMAGYLFLAARSSSLAAATFTTAFVGAAALPVYGVFLTPEILNFSLVFVAYFLWLYREVAADHLFRARWCDGTAAVLLGLATYSKPSNALLIAPLVFLPLWRRRWRPGVMLAAVFVATTVGCFSLTAAVSGEFNYQGGDRKTFYGLFPFDAPDATWDRRGIRMTTDAPEASGLLARSESLSRFGVNVKYFLVGRHFGFVPYFFPGVVALAAWIFSGARRDAWRLLTFGTLVVSVVVLLLVLPYTWSGGGGPPGNRYFLSLYPTLFFLVPPLGSAWPGLLAWLGGALFTAKMLMNPFVAAKFPYQTTERGFARRLPVEVTMANDLPIMLDSSRARVPYGVEPRVLLYFLDQNAFPPEPVGMWVSGGGRADILIRSVEPIHHLAVTAESPIRTFLTLSCDGPRVTVPLVPGKPVSFDLLTEGTRGLRSYAYLLSAQSSEGFVPHLLEPTSRDFRNLGALIRFTVVSVPPGPPE
jgi:hypothetical protein